MAEYMGPGQDNSDDALQFDSGEGQSRRAFLKAAVVGSAAVAAVGSAAAGGLALAHKAPPLTFRFGTSAATISPNDPCAVCTTGTDPTAYADQDTFNNQESLFIWVRFINVPAGSYTLDVTPTIQPSTASCGTATPLTYQSKKSAVTSWVLPAGGLACHPAALTDLPTGTSSDSLPVSFTITSTKDLLVQVHAQNNCTGSRDITITGLLKSGSATVMSCSHKIHINA